MQEPWNLLVMLPIYSLATWQAVETWRHGSIFFSWRQYNRDRIMTHRLRAVRLFGEGLNCPFCLPHWVALFWASSNALDAFLPNWLSGAIQTAAVALAITRASQIGNDAFKGLSWSQSPAGDVVAVDETITLAD